MDGVRNSVDYVLARSPRFEPGAEFDYHDGNPHLIGALIAKRSDMDLGAFAKRYLFDKLGIDAWHWDSARDGLELGAFGIYLRPRDLARFGQMLLDGGTFEGERVVSAAWIGEATKVWVQDSEPWPYGYYFWITPDARGYAAQGHGGQYVYVEPELDLVLVITAEPTVRNTEEVGISTADFERIRDNVRKALH